jgi:hypothetical protein
MRAAAHAPPACAGPSARQKRSAAAGRDYGATQALGAATRAIDIPALRFTSERFGLV